MDDTASSLTKGSHLEETSTHKLVVQRPLVLQVTA